jgi:hypothetical protein
MIMTNFIYISSITTTGTGVILVPSTPIASLYNLLTTKYYENISPYKRDFFYCKIIMNDFKIFLLLICLFTIGAVVLVIL